MHRATIQRDMPDGSKQPWDVYIANVELAECPECGAILGSGPVAIDAEEAERSGDPEKFVESEIRLFKDPDLAKQFMEQHAKELHPA